MAGVLSRPSDSKEWRLVALAAADADAEAEAAAASIWWVSGRVTSLHRASPRFHTTFCIGGGKKRQRGVWKPGGALGDA